MEVMTLGTLWLALLLMKELIIAAVKAIGIIALAISIGYGIYDRIRSKHGKTNKENTS